jgi:hypothetical protein
LNEKAIRKTVRWLEWVNEGLRTVKEVEEVFT